MMRFIFRRLLEAIPVFFIIVTATFFMTRFVPGGPFDGEKAIAPETRQALNAYYGLDESLPRQYAKFLKNLATLKLGPSYKYQGWSVNELIADKAKVSLELGAWALIFSVVFGMATGVFAATNYGRKSGKIAGAISLVGICLPSFVLGPVLILIFALKLKWFNAMGWQSFGDIALPAITLGLFYSAWIARLTRSSMLTEISKAYVRTAKAKGCSNFKIYGVHTLRNALVPVVAYIAPAAAGMLSGSFVVETIFQIPGLGRFFISSALDNDYTMIMGCVIVYAAFILFFNLLADIVLALINPQIAKSMLKK